jgi:hypothetical protein
VNDSNCMYAALPVGTRVRLFPDGSVYELTSPAKYRNGLWWTEPNGIKLLPCGTQQECGIYGIATGMLVEQDAVAQQPLKDSVTGSAGTAEGNQAAQASSGAGHDKPAQPVAEATCSDCRAPCTGTLCVYCSLRSSPKYVDSAVAERTAALPGQVAARERVAAFERRNRPRVTAESRELARSHPWDCDDSLVGD